MGNPLRVLHVVVNMNRGGAETLIMNLYRNIDRSKVQFDFLTCKEGAFDEEIKEMGGTIHRVPYISDVGHYKYIKMLTTFFSENSHYLIVHSHMDKMSGFVLQAAKKAGIPFRISHSHNTNSEGGIAARAYKWYAGTHIIPNATDLIACSNEAAKWLFNQKSKSAKILRNGIEGDRFSFSPEVRKQIREQLQLGRNTIVFGHVGRFNHQKNHSFLIEVFSEYHKTNENSLLLLVGDGPLRKEMEKKAKELFLEDKVKFLGIREDINHILQAFDIFVFPSLHEGLPVSLVEAQSSGLPCLISDRISREVDLGINLIHYLSLNHKQMWVEQLMEMATLVSSRNISAGLLSDQGYDIKETAAEIENYYLQITG